VKSIAPPGVSACGGAVGEFHPTLGLAGLLVVVCWNMAEKKEFMDLLRRWRTALVLIATLGLTLVENLTVGVVAGCLLAAAFAIYILAIPD
jgi:SulP family sulfate permease